MPSTSAIISRSIYSRQRTKAAHASVYPCSRSKTMTSMRSGAQEMYCGKLTAIQKTWHRVAGICYCGWLACAACCMLYVVCYSVAHCHPTIADGSLVRLELRNLLQ
jgi:hypothetical protein